MVSCEGAGNNPSPRKNSKEEASNTNEQTDEPRPNTSNIEAIDLFRDEVDFEITDFDYITGCGELFKDVKISSKLSKWPDSLKQTLAAELEKFPALDRVLDSVHGYYLIDEGAMGDINSGAPAGLACGADDGLGFIFLSKQLYLEIDPTEYSYSSEYTKAFQPGDYRISTLIHETLHAIDSRYFVNHDTGQFVSQRQDAAEYSWKGFDDSKYNDISVLALTRHTPNAPHRGPCIKRHHHGEAFPSFSLKSSPKEEAEDLEYMAEKTNFIAPYSMANSAEDFAETLTVYYIGTRSGEWPRWKTYDMSIINTQPKEGKLLYEFDSKEVITKSASHREKMCALAKLVFDENCESKLP